MISKLIDNHSKSSKYNKIKWIGIYNQEAHDTKIWPVALDGALPPTFNNEDRIANLNQVLTRYPGLKKMEWFTDIPHNKFYHVGGSFNQYFNAWPHRYFVVHNNALVFRTEFHIDPKTKEKYINLNDLTEFLEI